MKQTVNILQRAIHHDLGHGVLYLQNDTNTITWTWSLDTMGLIVDGDSMDSMEHDSNDNILLAENLKLQGTLENHLVEDIVRLVYEKQIEPSDESLLAAFNYYYKYDAFFVEV